MKNLDATLLKLFLTHAADFLTGDWILVGGTVLPAVGLTIRSTVDIDIINLNADNQDQTLKLMEIAEKLGLGAEAINTTAAYFLKKVGYKKEDLILLLKGKSAQFFRPSVELFWKLKVARLSESDLLDCQHYYNYCVEQKDKIEKSELRKILENFVGQEITLQKKERLAALTNLIS